MGDVAMTVPVLSAFSNAHPKVTLTVLTKKKFAPLFRDLKMVTVISADFNTTHKGVLGLYRLSKLLRNTQVEAVADLHNVLRTKILKFFLSSAWMAPIFHLYTEWFKIIFEKFYEHINTTHESHRQ